MDRFLFLKKKPIEEGRTKKLINFNLRDVTRNQRLLELLAAKTNDFFPLSEFSKTLQTFRLTKKIFQKS